MKSCPVALNLTYESNQLWKSAGAAVAELEVLLFATPDEHGADVLLILRASEPQALPPRRLEGEESHGSRSQGPILGDAQGAEELLAGVALQVHLAGRLCEAFFF